MTTQNFWSALPNKTQKKRRVFETSRGFLIVAVTDETDDAVVDRFRTLMLANAEAFDACSSQAEVYKLNPLLDRLAAESGLKDS